MLLTGNGKELLLGTDVAFPLFLGRYSKLSLLSSSALPGSNDISESGIQNQDIMFILRVHKVCHLASVVRFIYIDAKALSRLELAILSDQA